MKSTLTVFTLITLTLCFMISIQSCKKYEEGPGLSLYSKKKRVIGTWTIYDHSADGKDLFDFEVYSSGSFWCDNLNNKIEYQNMKRMNNYTWEFKEGSYIYTHEFVHRDIDQNTSASACQPYYETYTTRITDGGDWEFSSDKKQIILKPYFGTVSRKVFDIKKLGSTEIHIVGKVEGKSHDITLIRKY